MNRSQKNIVKKCLFFTLILYFNLNNLAYGLSVELPDTLFFKPLFFSNKIDTNSIGLVDSVKNINCLIYSNGEDNSIGDSIYISFNNELGIYSFAINSMDCAGDKRTLSSIIFKDDEPILLKINVGESNWHSGMEDGGGCEEMFTYLVNIQLKSYLVIHSYSMEGNYTSEITKSKDSTQSNEELVYFNSGHTNNMNIGMIGNHIVILQENSTQNRNIEKEVNKVFVYNFGGNMLTRNYKYNPKRSQFPKSKSSQTHK